MKSPGTSVVSADYLRNVGQNFLIGIDENHAGDVANFNQRQPLSRGRGDRRRMRSCRRRFRHRMPAPAPTAASMLPIPRPSVTLPTSASTPSARPMVAFPARTLPSRARIRPSVRPSSSLPLPLRPTTRSQINGQRSAAISSVRASSAPDLTASYTYSISPAPDSMDISTGFSASGGDQDFGANALNQPEPELVLRPKLARPPTSSSQSASNRNLEGFPSRHHRPPLLFAAVDPVAADTGAGDIFTSDFIGDGTVGNIVPGSNIGSFMRGIGPQHQ